MQQRRKGSNEKGKQKLFKEVLFAIGEEGLLTNIHLCVFKAKYSYCIPTAFLAHTDATAEACNEASNPSCAPPATLKGLLFSLLDNCVKQQRHCSFWEKQNCHFPCRNQEALTCQS